MVRKEVVAKLLESLREKIELMRPLQIASLAELTKDLVRYNGLLHLMQLSVEHVSDISAHLLASTDAAPPDGYREVILKAGEQGILPADFARRIAPMAGFRNIVVHHYLTVDPALVQTYLRENLQDFEQFIGYILAFLKDKPEN